MSHILCLRVTQFINIRVYSSFTFTTLKEIIDNKSFSEEYEIGQCLILFRFYITDSIILDFGIVDKVIFYIKYKFYLTSVILEATVTLVEKLSLNF